MAPGGARDRLKPAPTGPLDHEEGPILVRVQQKVLSQSGRLERNAKVLPATFDKRDVSYKSGALKLDSEFAWMPEMEFSRRNQNGDKFFGS